MLKCWNHIDRESEKSESHCGCVSKGWADRLMRWGNNRADQEVGEVEEVLACGGSHYGMKTRILGRLSGQSPSRSTPFDCDKEAAHSGQSCRPQNSRNSRNSRNSLVMAFWCCLFPAFVRVTLLMYGFIYGWTTSSNFRTSNFWV